MASSKQLEDYDWMKIITKIFKLVPEEHEMICALIYHHSLINSNDKDVINMCIEEKDRGVRVPILSLPASLRMIIAEYVLHI